VLVNKVNNDEDDPDKVLLLREQNNYIGQSNVDDYVHWPICYNVLNLYQWIQTSSKRQKPRKKTKINPAEIMQLKNQMVRVVGDCLTMSLTMNGKMLTLKT